MFGIKLLENYGLSETTFISSEYKSNKIKSKKHCKILPYCKVKLVNKIKGEKIFNEIYIKNPFLMLGYIKENGRLENNFEDGFFPTGDLGYITGDDELVITGRIKEII